MSPNPQPRRQAIIGRLVPLAAILLPPGLGLAMSAPALAQVESESPTAELGRPDSEVATSQTATGREIEFRQSAHA